MSENIGTPIPSRGIVRVPSVHMHTIILLYSLKEFQQNWMGQVCNILLKSFSSIIVRVQKYKMQISLSIQVQVDTTTYSLACKAT